MKMTGHDVTSRTFFHPVLFFLVNTYLIPLSSLVLVLPKCLQHTCSKNWLLAAMYNDRCVSDFSDRSMSDTPRISHALGSGTLLAVQQSCRDCVLLRACNDTKRVALGKRPKKGNPIKQEQNKTGT